ncbi:DUF262 domain-containing protein [Flavobacterium sp. DGU11]|uniref:DUF262 domain-containing protein n=1 Tax=Flavobacterium arundinis TaxID=3139143 RepID=A0ABU9HWL1_9FLAO
METSSSVRKMLAGNKILVPNYQRAYSWDTPLENNFRKTQTDVFLSDIDNYLISKSNSPFYFGHFLYEYKENTFYIIDGQQRLTTIIIFLSSAFAKLKSLRELSDIENEIYEDIIKRNVTYRFSTVDYDNQIFKDYVIDQIKTDIHTIETESAKRIISAFDYFTKKLKNKDILYLENIIRSISEASCTTHQVKNESEAIQMFIFQNDRGKQPSSLEVIKALFMYNIHLYSGDEKNDLILEIKQRFEKIYKSISSIEYKINEDDVLVYTQRVYFNSLWESNALEKINEKLNDSNRINFIMKFTHALSNSFEYLNLFFGRDERKNFSIHSFITIGNIGIAIPFIIKAYKFGLPLDEIGRLCSSLESLVFRHRLIGTRAELITRINQVFIEFIAENTNIDPIVDRVNFLKNSDEWWWSYWNDVELQKSLQGAINHSLAKYILWKYENHLESLGNSGYNPSRYDKIVKPELEHISPKVTSGESLARGYSKYDDEFVNEYLNCLGNYLLISKSHNCSIGNKPFKDKYDSYNNLAQQREIRLIVNQEKLIWSRQLIKDRKKKIIDFIVTNL